MYAKLITNDFRVHDFQNVEAFEVRQGQKFSIALFEAAMAWDVFTNNDPSLSVKPFTAPAEEPGLAVIEVNANATGVTKLQIRDANGGLVKQWLVDVFSDQASTLGVTATVERL